MKTLAFFFVIFLSVVTLASSQGLTRIGGGGGGSSIPSERYPMKGVEPGSAKFNSIFADVSQIAGKRRDLESHFTIIQTISTGFFLAEKGDQLFAIELPGRSFADQTKLVMKIEHSDRLHTYTTTLGASAKVGIYKVTNPRERFTHQRFIASLRRGETFTIRRVSGSQKKDLIIVWE